MDMSNHGGDGKVEVELLLRLPCDASSNYVTRLCPFDVDLDFEPNSAVTLIINVPLRITRSIRQST